MKPIHICGAFDTRISARAYCTQCGHEHSMVIGYAEQFAKQLFRTLTQTGRIDFEVPDEQADPRFSTDYLYGNARGQMFGVLVCRDMDDKTWLLKAFSGQYNGVWEVDGWVPPLVDVPKLQLLSHGVERLIKRIGRQMDALPSDSLERKRLGDKRKAISQALMKDIHAMYKIPDCCGGLTPLPEAVSGPGGIPTGTGDCCAPKLLGYAARHSLTPIGLAEFFFGRENKSGSKQHGGLYSACKDKCGRILGHMLCGACQL